MTNWSRCCSTQRADRVLRAGQGLTRARHGLEIPDATGTLFDRMRPSGSIRCKTSTTRASAPLVIEDTILATNQTLTYKSQVDLFPAALAKRDEASKQTAAKDCANLRHRLTNEGERP
jgi:hypothetical protein